MKLEIGNSTCKISEMTPQQFADLRDLMSYSMDAQAQHFSRNYNPKKYLLDKKGIFPTGLLYIVQQYVYSTGCQVTAEDKRVQPKAIKGLFSLRLEQ